MTQNYRDLSNLYVFTMRGSKISPIVEAKGFDQTKELNVALEYEGNFSDGSVATIYAFQGSELLKGFEDKIQAVPLDEFLDITETLDFELKLVKDWRN